MSPVISFFFYPLSTPDHSHMLVNEFACVPQRHAHSHVEVEDYRANF